MFKFYLFLVVATAASIPSFAQFTSTSGNTTTTDKVGVGTAAPQFNLDVNGNGGFSGPVWFAHSSNIAGYSWVNAALTTNSIEIVNNIGTVNHLSPTLAFHRYGSGGPQFRLAADGSNILYLESSGANSARNPNAYGGGPNNYFNKLYIDGALSTVGKVGIGTNSPASQFQVDDGCTKASIGSAAGPNLNYGTSYLGFNAARNADNQNNWTVQGDGAHNGGGVIYTTIFGEIYFSPIESNGTNDKVLSDSQIKDRIKFRISPDGTTYAKSIKVETANWPDYVFKPTYKLRSLDAVKAYIDENKHLPDLPSEAEVAKDGVNLGELVKLQTKKIEELTLYLIEQNKQLKTQQAQIGFLLKKAKNKH